MISDSRLVTTLLVLTLLGGLGCGSETTSGPSGPDPGPLEVRVEKAPPNAGGLVLEVFGELTDSVRSVGAARIWQDPGGENRTRIVVAGIVQEGPILTLPAADRRNDYSIRVLDGAASLQGDYASQTPGEFSIVIARGTP